MIDNSHNNASIIENKNWKYIPACNTNIKSRFESLGYSFRDIQYRKSYDFSGVEFSIRQMAQMEE
jgi:hypothetical protein